MSTSTVPTNWRPAQSADRLKRRHAKAFDPIFLEVASMLANGASCRAVAHRLGCHEMDTVRVCRWLHLFFGSHAELLRTLPDRSVAGVRRHLEERQEIRNSRKPR